MTEDQELELMASGRLIAAVDHLLIPLLQLKIKQRTDMACGRFLNGETNFIADIAYIQGLKEIEQHLKKTQSAANAVTASKNT